MKKYTLYVVIILVILTLFVATRNHLQKQLVPAAANLYKNISYTIDGQSVRLTDGISEVEVAPGSASKIVTRYFGNEVRADFNGDGVEDIAFLITQNSGGSGTFYYVVVALSTPNGFIGTNAVLLGDRITPQSTDIKDGDIVVNFAERKSDQPMTASPSIGVSMYLNVVNNELVTIR